MATTTLNGVMVFRGLAGRGELRLSQAMVKRHESWYH
jgi:hypothetical protein